MGAPNTFTTAASVIPGRMRRAFASVTPGRRDSAQSVKAKASAKLAYGMLGDDKAAAKKAADAVPAAETTPDTTIETGTVAPAKPAAPVKPKKAK